MDEINFHITTWGISNIGKSRKRTMKFMTSSWCSAKHCVKTSSPEREGCWHGPMLREMGVTAKSSWKLSGAATETGSHAFWKLYPAEFCVKIFNESALGVQFLSWFYLCDPGRYPSGCGRSVLSMAASRLKTKIQHKVLNVLPCPLLPPSHLSPKVPFPFHLPSLESSPYTAPPPPECGTTWYMASFECCG